MFAVSLAGFLGAVNNITWLLFIYLAVIFIAMWVLLGFTVFAFLVTNKSAGAITSNKGISTYKTIGFSTWLQDQVNDANKWAPIRACLSAGGTCSFLKSLNASDPAAVKLSPIQAGCCYPPDSCDPSLYNSTAAATVSRLEQTAAPPSTAAPSVAAPALAAIVNNLSSNATDCVLYGSDPLRLCYSCDSCKAGFLKTLHDEWRIVAYISLGVVLLLLVIYTIGCCSYRRAKREEGFFGKV
eukprot:TRINITY_DN1207_c0_g1_i3.p1 TRINITY_DN1207_c0_g1~~TRINITY_DN1207_c0_g1_i3.p1  ORF type:complete len:240 (+),score=4.15 TRINITY_DN1207_c0_g1_i3:463-1182(+)